MKKSFIIVCFFMLTFILTACAPSSSISTDPAGNEAAPTETTVPATTEHTEHVFSTPKDCSEVEICTICGAEGTNYGPHRFRGGDCQNPSICRICGAEGELGSHNFVGGDCLTPSVCSVCGLEGELKPHHYSNPTCTEPGVCSVCGDETPAYGHAMAEATCTEAAHCKRCDYVDGEPLGHDGIGLCSRCGNLGDMSFSGSGDKVVGNINLPSGHIYTLHFVNSGSSNFIVHSYDSTEYPDLLVNEIGRYDGIVLLMAEYPIVLEIQSNGNWTVEINTLEATDQSSLSGRGDYVTPIMSFSTSVWRFTHSGRSNFIVKAYTTDGYDLLVNEIGSYSGEKYVQVPAGSNLFFEITADGDWTIEKID